MRIMKKLLSVAVSLSLCASLAAPAFAASFDDLQNAIDGVADEGVGYEIKDSGHQDHYGYDRSEDTEGNVSYGVESWKSDDSDGREVKLNENVVRDKEDETKSITIKDDVSIDLNGNYIQERQNEKPDNSATIKVEEDATLTLENSGSTEKFSGKVFGAGEATIENAGTLNLEDGTTIQSVYKGAVEGKKDGTYSIGVGVSTTGEVNISEGATVVGGKTGGNLTLDDKTKVMIHGDGVDVKEGGTLNTEGRIEGYYGAYGENGAEINVNGGKIDATGIGAYVTGAGTELTVNGGEISVERPTGVKYGISINDGASVTIREEDPVNNPTKITSDVENGNGFGIAVWGNGKADDTKLTVEGGTITGTMYGIVGNGTNDWTYYGGTEITITDGKVSGKYAAIYHPQYGTLIIGSKETDPTLSGYVGVQICAGVVDVYGGKFEATGATDNRPLKGTVNLDGLIDDASAISVVKRNGYISPPTVHIYDGSFSAIGNDALLTYGWTNNKVPTPGTKFDWADLQYTGVVGGRYSQEIKEVYLDKINFNDPDDLFFNLPHNKPNSDGQVICIHVDDETLPYQVGYLTGAPATGSTTALETGSAGRLNVRYMLNGQTVSNSLDQLIAENGWTSADESVLTVGQDGTITAVAPGETNVTVTLINGETVTFTITVTEPTPELPVIDDADDDDDDTTAAPGTEITDGAVPLASGPITRAEFINYLWQRDGQSESAGVCTFTDVEDTHQYFDALCWAEENGVAKAYLNAEGHEDGTFEPDELVTVGAAREFLTNFAAYAEMVMPEMKTLTGPDEEPLFTCDDVIREFFGD